MTKRMTAEEMAKEAAYWESKEASLAGWVDATDEVPRAGESEAISLRMPTMLLHILKEFARRQGIGYQVLIKRWLDDRVATERTLLHEKIKRDKEEKARLEAEQRRIEEQKLVSLGKSRQETQHRYKIPKAA
jgi:hypothetical protein